MEYRSHNIRVARCKPLNDFPRAVGRTILTDNQLNGKRRFLPEHAPNGLGDELLMVEGGHRNTHLRGGVTGRAGE